MSETTTPTFPPPPGPGRMRPTHKIKSGWQVWDSATGEWLTVDIIAVFNSGRVRYVCMEKEPNGEYVTFDTTKVDGHKIWSRNTVEQRQAGERQ